MEIRRAASVILAAGKGTRMTGYEGNKTLLPLVPDAFLFSGHRPLLFEVLENLPYGPKAIVINYRKEAVIAATKGMGLEYAEQPTTNGTGGAILAARNFIAHADVERIIITMGDVPFVKRESYMRLIDNLNGNQMVVLAFSPVDHAKYGALLTEGSRVHKIVEWNYWNEYTPEKQRQLKLFNAGVYAFDRAMLLSYLDILKLNPHQVKKVVNGVLSPLEEYFLTDLVHFMTRDGLSVGFVEVENEEEVMGVDTPESLKSAQAVYRSRKCMPVPGS